MAAIQPLDHICVYTCTLALHQGHLIMMFYCSASCIIIDGLSFAHYHNEDIANLPVTLGTKLSH